jgi:hypothetical protein
MHPGQDRQGVFATPRGKQAQVRQGRQNVAHGGSRGKNRRREHVYSPGWGDRMGFLPRLWRLSPIIFTPPRVTTLGHIMPPRPGLRGG